MCCSMRSPKLIFFSGGLLFYRCLFFCRAIGDFSPCIRALGNVEFLLFLVGSGKLLRAEHGLCCNDDDRCFGDGVVGPFGFGLGIFEVIYILGYSLTIDMVPLHLVFECEDIKGMESPTCRHCRRHVGP